jgi:DNA-binding beta-propeller fold protein YncE
MRHRLLLAVVGVATPTGIAAFAYTTQTRDTRPCLPATDSTATPAVVALPAATTGNLLVANQFSSTGSVIELATGNVTTLDAGTEPHDVAVSPDGRWGVLSNFGPGSTNDFRGNKLIVVDMAAKKVVRTIDLGDYRGLHDILFRPGSATNVVVTAQTSRRIVEVDIIAGRIVGAAETRGDRSHTLAITRDGRTAFTTNEGTSTVSKMDLTTHSFVAAFPATENVEGVGVTADGRELWVGSTAIGGVQVFDTESGKVVATLQQFRYPVRVVVSPDGRRVVISDPGCKAVVVADPATRRVVRVIRVDAATFLVGEIAPDSRVAFAASAGAGRVVSIDLETGRRIAEYKTGRHPDGVAWGPTPSR